MDDDCGALCGTFWRTRRNAPPVISAERLSEIPWWMKSVDDIAGLLLEGRHGEWRRGCRRRLPPRLSN